jgi:K+-transporting ATPase ATPase B chain
LALHLFPQAIGHAYATYFFKEFMRNAVREKPVILKNSEPPDGSKLTLVLTRRNIWTAFKQSLIMLRPDLQKKNRVMFIVEIAAILTLLCVIHAALAKPHAESLSYFISLDAWLFLTVIGANFVTALTE